NREPETVGAGGPWGFHGDEPETTPNGAPPAADFGADDNSDDVDTAPTRVEVPEFAEPALTGPHDEPVEELVAEPTIDADAADEEPVQEPVAEPVVDADAADEEPVQEGAAEEAEEEPDEDLIGEDVTGGAVEEAAA